VEEVNLRVTSIRANDGTVWFVPNGEIRMVGNAAKDWAKAVVDVVVPKGADLAQAITAITDEVDKMAADEVWAEALTEKPQVLGVETMGTEGVTVRVEVKTAPGNRARVARELRTRIGARLYKEGIAARQDWRVEPPLASDGTPGVSPPEAPAPPEPPLPPLPLS
jgi:moderate conductance mechanosensitive channel